MDIVALGRGYGARTAHAATADEVRDAFTAALAFKGTSVIEVVITSKLHPLLG